MLKGSQKMIHTLKETAITSGAFTYLYIMQYNIERIWYQKEDDSIY